MFYANIALNYAKKVYKVDTNAWYYKPFLCNSYQRWFNLSKIARIDTNIGMNYAKKVYKPFFCAIRANVGLPTVKIVIIYAHIGINYAKKVYKSNTSARCYKTFFLCKFCQC